MKITFANNATFIKGSLNCIGLVFSYTRVDNVFAVMQDPSEDKLIKIIADYHGTTSDRINLFSHTEEVNLNKYSYYNVLYAIKDEKGREVESCQVRLTKMGIY